MDSIRKQFPQIEETAWPVLEAWAVLLREWNTKINLISRKDIEYLEARHLSHCLAITNHLKLMSGARIMDVGTGGGFPGIIMAICYPQAHFTLIDSIGKKIAVVQDLVDKLGLKIFTQLVDFTRDIVSFDLRSAYTSLVSCWHG